MVLGSWKMIFGERKKEHSESLKCLTFANLKNLNLWVDEELGLWKFENSQNKGGTTEGGGSYLVCREVPL